MQKIKIYLSLITVIIIISGVVSCGKEKEIKEINTELRKKGVPLFQACWEEWGRESRDCGSWGLCNFNGCWAWEDDYPCCGDYTSGGSGNITFNDLGIGILTIELDSTYSEQNTAIQNQIQLIIDYDITKPTAQAGSYITLKHGIYNFNPNIGLYGGYEVNAEMN